MFKLTDTFPYLTCKLVKFSNRMSRERSPLMVSQKASCIHQLWGKPDKMWTRILIQGWEKYVMLWQCKICFSLFWKRSFYNFPVRNTTKCHLEIYYVSLLVTDKKMKHKIKWSLFPTSYILWNFLSLTHLLTKTLHVAQQCMK